MTPSTAFRNVSGAFASFLGPVFALMLSPFVDRMTVLYADGVTPAWMEGSQEKCN